MSEQHLIDGFEFAGSASTLRGKVDVADLGRLQDQLYSNEGEIQYFLQGAKDKNGHPLIKISVEGTIRLKCRRCGGELESGLGLASCLALVKDESELPDIEDEDPDVDSIVVTGRLDVLSMVEDEILLDLPFSNSHAEGECVAKSSPFSALRDLR